MNNTDEIACHECDLLINLPKYVEIGKKATCPRCHHHITSGHDNPVDLVIALCFTAVIILAIANSFAFISFATQGHDRTILLIQASSELYVQGFQVLSVLVLLFIVILPLLYLLLLLTILLPNKLGLRKSPPIFLGKVISHLLPWTMSEVFLIGVLVALIKVIAMADITLGVSFWAYVLFAPLFTYIVSIADNHHLWHWIEHGS